MALLLVMLLTVAIPGMMMMVMGAPQIAINFYLLSVQVQEPQKRAAEQASADDVPQQRWHDALPGVQPDGQAGRAEPQAERDEEHVGGDVVEAERDEGEDRSPDADDLGYEIASLHAQITGEADEPVTADAP